MDIKKTVTFTITATEEELTEIKASLTETALTAPNELIDKLLQTIIGGMN